MIPLRIQMALAVLLGLATGLLLDPRSLAEQLPAPAPTAGAPRPLVTHSNMLMVTALLRREGPPEILRLTPLERGRLSLTTPGDSTLKVIDSNGALLYELSFQSRFLAGEPLRLRDEVTLIFVVPLDPAAKRIIVTTTGGRAEAVITP